MTAPFFRQSALNAQHHKWLGEIILIRPLTFTFFTLFAATVALALIAFAYFGTYTKRSTVIGQLIPDTGLLKIYPTQTAVAIGGVSVIGTAAFGASWGAVGVGLAVAVSPLAVAAMVALTLYGVAELCRE